jgi:hypothetical protein
MALFDAVFEGGGAKGSAFVGALTALQERGHPSEEQVRGTCADRGSALPVRLSSGWVGAAIEMHSGGINAAGDYHF